jgi:hypothetical protein
MLKNVKRAINESGDTERGQYMIGRLHRRSAQRSATDDYYRRRNISKEYDNLFKHNKGNWEAYDKGYDDEGIDLPRLKRGAISANYGTYKMKDMDKIGKQFINYIEKSDAILQYIVECMGYNQKGEKDCSPLPEIIPMFEEDVLGYECTPDEKKAIERAFNEWWHYAEAELMPEEYYGDIEESYRPRKNRKINEDIDTGQYMSAQERREIGAYRMQEENRKREKYAKHYKYIHELRNLSDWIYDDCKVDVTDELVNAIHKIKISMK